MTATTDNTATEGQATVPCASDRLSAAARKAMVALYPDKAKAIESGKHWRVVDLFAMDALGEKGKCMFLHRLDEDRQQAEIGENPDEIFVGLSESMIAFYRKKVDELKS